MRPHSAQAVPRAPFNAEVCFCLGGAEEEPLFSICVEKLDGSHLLIVEHCSDMESARRLGRQVANEPMCRVTARRVVGSH